MELDRNQINHLLFEALDAMIDKTYGDLQHYGKERLHRYQTIRQWLIDGKLLILQADDIEKIILKTAG